jgi:hypothetical protein
MGTVPNPRTWVQGEIQPYTTINAEVYQTVAWLLEPPMCKVRQTTTQSVANTTYTAITFQTEDADPYNWHNANTNPSRITPTFPGWYRGWYSLGFATTIGGNFREGFPRKNATQSEERARRDAKPPTTASTISLRGIPFYMQFNGTTDYVELYMYQDTGAAMSTPVLNHTQCELFLRWWGPL